MARAKTKPIAGEIQGPDFDAAMAIWNNDIRPANRKQKQAMKEASDAWKVVKGDHRVHKGGFAKAMQVADMEEADQQAFLRSFNAGLVARNVSLHADLVDQAEGSKSNTVIPVEFGSKDKRGDLDVPEGGGDTEVDQFDAAAPDAVAAE